MFRKFQYGLVMVAMLSMGVVAMSCSDDEMSVEEATNTTNASAAAKAAPAAAAPAAKAAAPAAKEFCRQTKCVSAPAVQWAASSQLGTHLRSDPPYWIRAQSR